MSPLNRGPLLSPRVPPAGVWPPPRFGGRLPPPGMPPRMPPPPMSAVFGPMRQRLPPPPRPGGISRPGAPLPLFAPRGRAISPLVPPIGLRGSGPRGPHMQGWPRRILPPQVLPHMRPRFSIGNGNVKGKVINNSKKVNKLEELELKKPWMTDEIRSEIQKKNKLYVKAKKNKDAKEWEEFKDLRNKVTRMIRDAKNEYLAKHPEQAHLYENGEEFYDQRDENYVSSDEELSYYCEVCDKDFPSEEKFSQHKQTHKLCGIDGCTFSAHPLLVEKHIKMQHSTGLYQRMKNLKSPEDIKKWIQERKKKYPTKANIELRKAEEAEKEQRGEVIKKQVNIQSTMKKCLNSRDKKRRHRKRPGFSFNEPLPSEIKMYRGLHSFSGTINLQQIDSSEIKSEDKSDDTQLLKNNIDISDEEDISQMTISCTNSNLNVPSLVANYGSDSDNEDEGPLEEPIKKIKLLVDEKMSENVSHSIYTQEDLNKRVRHAEVSKNMNVKGRKTQKNDVKKHLSDKCNVRKNMKKRTNPHKLQLLHKLLSRSIQHERNLICQCIKYIIDNEFFD